MGKKKIICLLSMCLCLVMLSACGKQTVSASLEETVNDISTFTVSDDVKIVGLGEASHGAHEYQQMKAEVFQALVANNGCTTFIIEGDFGGCLKVEQYIHGADGTAKDAAAEIGFAIYRTKEMAELIDWMREYNKTAPEGKDLHFYGMDMQRYDNNKAYLFEVLDAAAPELSEKYKEAFADLTDENRLTLEKDTLSKAKEEAQTLSEEMEKKKEDMVSVVGETAFDFAKECANSIQECSVLAVSDSDYNTLRDGYMADKVNWYMEHGDGSVLFINGHNGHIGKTSPLGYPCLGNLLSEEYKTAYFAVGTDAGNTIFNSQTDQGFEEAEVKNENNFTSLATDTDSYYYLDFASVKDDENWQKILNSSQKMTSLNVSVSKAELKMASFYTQKIVPSETYDGVIIFSKVTPTEVEL